MINKHAALYEWLAKCPLLPDTLIASFLNERDGSVAVTPISNPTYIKRYLRGRGIMQYEFAVSVMLSFSDSTDETNTNNLFLVHTLQEWLREQEKLSNYPDFGADCSDYQLEVLSDMPQLAEKYQNGMAKYQFYATLKYFYEGD
ncbi:hypothetical protein AGMMS49975_22600 [Clostridia bacterium]|nr:hypothetical protein AGMMS49975_22600 [Clostridia bacterium]